MSTDSTLDAASSVPTSAESSAEGPDRGADDLDLAVVTGTLSSDPTTTELASGSILHRYEVTARQSTSTDTVPVVWFDPSRPPALVAGDAVVVVGRVRRRFFRAGGATRSSTEVVASSVSRRASTRRAVISLEAAAVQLSG
ncbi:MAG: hypothetical protein OSA99_09490 [Acidimicrobiales bacterium]|nr:hypothetical protein [Acidimicrobiales bacterium]